MNKMDPELKGKWVAALRSDEYKQSTGTLNDNGQFCCLGVLCDILVKDGVLKEFHVSEDGYTSYGVSEDKCATATLPYGLNLFGEAEGEDNVWGEYEVTDEEEDLGFTGDLAKDNDEGRSFAEIADIIEKKF